MMLVRRVTVRCVRMRLLLLLPTHGLEEGEGMLSYRSEVAVELVEACRTELLTYVSRELLFPTFIPNSE